MDQKEKKFKEKKNAKMQNEAIKYNKKKKWKEQCLIVLEMLVFSERQK